MTEMEDGQVPRDGKPSISARTKSSGGRAYLRKKMTYGLDTVQRTVS